MHLAREERTSDRPRRAATAAARGWEPATAGDLAALALLWALLAPFAWRTATAVAAGGHGGQLVAALGLGLLAADLISGVLPGSPTRSSMRPRRSSVWR
ncbi:MAG: hypothetical protein U0802_11975 [Candidatus Binatia bacterium]